MKLQRMAPPKGSRKRRKLLGRGESSGRGKTSGRGGKGQTARSGGRIRLGFEGGQMPLYRRLPKKGFTSRKRVLGINRYNVVNLSALEIFDAGTEINAELLRAKGIISSGGKQAGIKLLANGKLSKKLTITVDKASASAVKAVEALGGKVILPVEKTA